MPSKNNALRVFLIIIFSLYGCSNNSQNSEIPQPVVPVVPDTFDFCPKKSPNTYEDYTLLWTDEFSSDQLDQTVWNYMYGDGSAYGIPAGGTMKSRFMETAIRMFMSLMVVCSSYLPFLMMVIVVLD